MGNFRLFKKTTGHCKDDPVFGRIAFERGIWTFIPGPQTEAFMISVDAPESGPSQLQRDFFQKLRANLSEFEQGARNFIRSRLDPTVEVSQLSIYSIEVGSDDEIRQQRFILEMSDADATVIHRITFSGSEAIEYGFDN